MPVLGNWPNREGRFVSAFLRNEPTISFLFRASLALVGNRPYGSMGAG